MNEKYTENKGPEGTPCGSTTCPGLRRETLQKTMEVL